MEGQGFRVGQTILLANNVPAIEGQGFRECVDLGDGLPFRREHARAVKESQDVALLSMYRGIEV